MIAYISDPETKEFRTTGCGCCSATYYFPKDKEDIIKAIKRNISVALDSCVLLEIDFNALVNEVSNER